jgi:hypothetical protein
VRHPTRIRHSLLNIDRRKLQAIIQSLFPTSRENVFYSDSKKFCLKLTMTRWGRTELWDMHLKVPHNACRSRNVSRIKGTMYFLAHNPAHVGCSDSRFRVGIVPRVGGIRISEMWHVIFSQPMRFTSFTTSDSQHAKDRVGGYHFSRFRVSEPV